MVNSSRRPPPGKDFGMKKPLIYSVVFHTVLVLFAIFGLPHFMKEREIVESVPVELVSNISELTTTNKPPVKAPPKEEKKPDEPPPKKEETKKPPPPADPPPPTEDVLKPAPKDPEKTPEEIAEKILKKQPEKKVEKKPVKKPPEKPKKEEKPKKDTQQSDMDQLLKDLDPNTDPPQPDTPPNETVKDTTPEPSPNVSRFSDVLSMSEIDALRSQLAGCWSVLAGGANAEDLRVEVRITINPDNSAGNPQILDTSRYNSNTFYRAAADSALRALRNPRCTPLNLPPGKYSGQTMVIVFDPKDMF